MIKYLTALAVMSSSCPIMANTLDYDASFRFRHQQVNDDSLKYAKATTLLTRVEGRYLTDNDLTFFGQYDHVWALDKNSYNSITYFNDHGIIPDPPGGELNQLNVNWQFLVNWRASIGRQVISFDNERHIGNAAYWQNDQTFDAASVQYNNGFNWQLNYSYVNKAHRIYGDHSIAQLPSSDSRYPETQIRPNSELGNHQHNTHLVNLAYVVNPATTLSSFVYLLDNETAAEFSSNTVGLHLEGTVKPDKLKYNYTVEIAWQTSAAKNPTDYQARYLLTELGVQYRSHRLDIGYEYLGDDNKTVFQTSLGTNHKFFGWADVFGAYNGTSGLSDTYLSYAGRKAKIRWKIVAHSFESLANSKTLGKELDFELAWRYTRKWEFKLLAAYYKANESNLYTNPKNVDLSTIEVSTAYNF